MHCEAILPPLLAALGLWSCAVKDRAATPTLRDGGGQPTFYASASNSAAVGAGTLVFADTKAGMLHRFALDPLRVEVSSPLPFDTAEQSVLVADDGAYSLVIGGGDYAVVDADGNANRNPVGMAGRITGLAYDGKTNRLALFDDLGSTALLALTPAGALAKSTLLGPVVTDVAHLMTAATMTTGGRLVLALAGPSLAVIDVDASIDDGRWRLEMKKPQRLMPVSWLASVAGQPDLVMARDGGRLLTIDTATGDAVDTVDLQGATPVGAFRGARPAVATAGAGGSASFYFPQDDGKIGRSDVLLQHAGTISEGVVDLERGTLTVLGQGVVSRYRIADSLVVAQLQIPRDARPIVTPDYLVLAFDSALGRLERRDYSVRSPHAASVDSFNLGTILARAAH